jgi:hypothetical protein
LRQAARRNLHDGAQQQFIGLGVLSSLARRIAEHEGREAAASFDALQPATTDVLENLRDLARGTYPRLLADWDQSSVFGPGAGPTVSSVATKGLGVRWDSGTLNSPKLLAASGLGTALLCRNVHANVLANVYETV